MVLWDMGNYVDHGLFYHIDRRSGSISHSSFSFCEQAAVGYRRWSLEPAEMGCSDL